MIQEDEHYGMLQLLLTLMQAVEEVERDLMLDGFTRENLDAAEEMGRARVRGWNTEEMVEKLS